MTDPLGLINNNGSPQALRPTPPAGPNPEPTTSFKDVLMSNIEQVNKLQQDAEMAIEDLASGRRDDIDGVLIAKQKADLAFQMLLQVRNKMIAAYEEVKQMKV